MAGSFVLTPHKLSTCILLQVYAVPALLSPPFCPLQSSVRHRLALFLLRLSKASDGFLEPTLEELGVQLKEAIGEVGEVVAEQLASRLLGFTSPEDLFTFVLGLREILAPASYTVPDTGSDDESLLVEQTSLLGQFLRHCILSFNLLSFEGTCRLLAELDGYRRPALTIGNGSIIATKGTGLNQSDEEVEDEVDELEDDDDENFEHGERSRSTSMTPQGQRVGSASRAFGVPLIPMEGRDELEMQDFPDLPELEGFGPRHAGNGGSVRDGGFSFAFGDSASKGEPPQACSLRTSGQVEAYLKEQAAVIEKELGATSKAEADAKFAQIEKLAPGMHRVHYLQYLNSLYHGDYPAAIDSLHRYFDYSAGRGSSGGSGSDASVGRFQAGLLSLGAMHAHFGHVTQALQALSETVRIAQQNNDDVCLAHALAALCHLLSEVGVSANASSATEESCLDLGIGPSLAVQQQLLLLLRRCLKRASELKLPHLVAFSRLSLAKFDLKHVRKLPQVGALTTFEQLGTSPIEVCKNLRLSPYLLSDSVFSASNMTTNSQLLGPGVFSQPSGVGSNMVTSSLRLGPMPEPIKQLAGTSHLLRAASWELYGSSLMVRMSSLVHGYCYSKAASADDVSLAYAKLVQHLAQRKGYLAALSALSQAAKNLPFRDKLSLRVLELQLIHERALHCGNIKLAHIACSELSATASPVLGVDMVLKFEASYRHALTLLASGDYSEAEAAARKLFSLCYKYDMQLQVVKVLLLLADIHRKSGSSGTGLPYVLASLTLCQSLNLDLLQAESMVTLAELWLGLGVDHAEKALNLLQRSLPLVLGHGGLPLRARANLCVARCYLSNPSFSVVLDADLVLEALEQSIEDYRILENKSQASEAYYLQALVYNALGKLEDRDNAAACFQTCVVELNLAREESESTVPLL